jgi:hypothetical protein
MKKKVHCSHLHDILHCLSSDNGTPMFIFQSFDCRMYHCIWLNNLNVKIISLYYNNSFVFMHPYMICYILNVFTIFNIIHEDKCSFSQMLNQWSFSNTLCHFDNFTETRFDSCFGNINKTWFFIIIYPFNDLYCVWNIHFIKKIITSRE